MKTLHTIYTSFAKRVAFILTLLLTFGVTTAWAAEYSLTPDNISTSLNNTKYITSLTEFTYDGITWKMNQWNPSTLQIKTNQGTNTNEFHFYNTTAFPGKITKVVITFKALTVSNENGFMFIGGTSVQTGTSNGTSGKWDANNKTITWTPAASDNFTFFAFYQNGKVASGTNYLAESDAIVVTYESGYAVTYKNGGRGTAPTDETATSVTLSEIKATGYTNTGWKADVEVKNGSTTISAGTLIENETTVTLTQATTFTAQWQINSYTVTWKPNGGNWSGNASDKVEDYNYGATITTPTNPTRYGYNFTGWNPTPATTMPASDQTYTAQWIEKSLTNYRTSCTEPCEQLGAATGLSVQTDYVENGETYVKFSWTPADNTKSYATKQVICIGKVGEEKKCTDLLKNQNWSGDLLSKLTPGEYEWTIQAIGDGETYCDGEVVSGPNFTIEEPLTDNCRWVEIALEDITPEDEIVVTMGNDKTVFALGTEKITNSPKSQEITITSGMIDINQDFNYSKYTWSISTVAGGYQLQPYGTTQYLYGVASYITISSTPTTFSIFTSPENGNKCFMYTIGSTYYLGHGAEDGQTAWKRVTTYDNLLKSNTLKFYKKTCLPANKFWIDYELANITCTTNPTPSQIDKTDEDLLLEFSANDGYKLPEQVSITMGGFPLSEDAFEWEAEEGLLYIRPDGEITGDIVITVEGCELLAIPTNLKANNITSSSATLSWDEIDHATEYQVHITDDDDSTEDIITTTSNTYYEVTGLSSASEYLWGVTPIASGYCGLTQEAEIFTTLDVYTVTFNTDGGTPIAPQTIDHGSKATKPANPTKTGYTFAGWYTEPTCTNLFNFNIEITANTTLYAKWTEWSYTITYAKGSPADEITGEHAPGTKMYTSAVTIAGESFFRLGYKQTGWSKTDGGQKDYDLLGIYGTNENVTLYPYWTIVHTITWMADGSAHDEATYLDGETLALPDTVPEACQGSAFMGWTAAKDYFNANTAPTYVTAGSAVNDNATYYAVYANLEGDNTDYSNTYTSNVAISGTDAKVVINSGQYDAIKAGTTKNAGSVEITIPAGTTKLCFHMAGWNGENGKTISLSGATAKPASFATVADEGISGSGTTYTLKGNVEKYVYSTELTNITEETTITLSNGGGNQRFVVWGVNASSASYKNYSTSCSSIYNISYELDGGENGCENGSVTAGGDYNICADEPTKIGYTFKHWTDGTNTYDADATIEDVQKDITLTAVWEANTYEITWWSNGVEYTTTSHTFDTELQLPADPYTCYGAKTFVGWTGTSFVNENGEGIVYVNENTNPSENKTYYAVFADEELGEPEKHDATLSFASKDQRTEFSSTQQVWEQNGITLTNTRGSGNNDAAVGDYFNPARIYAASSISIVAPGNITKIVFTCSGESYVDDMQESAGNSATADGTVVTVNLDGSSNTFEIAKVTAQIRLSSLTVTYLSTPEITLSNYTTTPTGCAEMEVAENAYVTSASGQSVKVNVPVKANNFANDMTITAAVEDGNFSVANVSAVADGVCTVTLAYKPTSPKTAESANVTLTAKAGDNEVTSTTFTLNGRSLPETFAVVAKVGNMWYALPEVGYEAEKHATAYPVEVDDATDPTEVTSAVANNAAWSLRQVYQAQHSNAQHDRYVVSGANVVFENKQNPAKLLNASAQGDKGSNNYLLTSAQYDNYYSTNPGLYEWTLATKDLETYTLTNVQRIDKQINISTNAAFGLHTADVVTSDLRFLPIQGTYTTLATQVVEWKEKSVVVMYNGDPAQTASVSVNAGEAQTTTLSSAQKDIAVYELTADGLATNPTQQLSITIGSEKVILPIPYIVSGEKTDLALLPGATVAARQEVAKVADLVVLKDATLTADGAKTNSYKFRNVTVYGGGKLVVPADKGFGVNTLTLRIGGVTKEGNYDYVYPEFELNTTYDGAYSNTSGKINLDYVTTKDQYYTFVVPFKVETKDIKYPVDIYGSNVEAANRGSFEFQYYDGEARAAGEKGWKVVEEDPTDGATLTAHQGYTFYGMPKKVSVNGGTSTRQKFGIHRIPMTETAAKVMSHENSEQTIAVSAYPSQYNINAGWNLIGNPYMSTITGLNNESIQTGTIVLVDDRWQWSDQADQYNHRFIVFPSNDGEWYYTSQAINAKLPAFKNFFVQIAGEEINAISIPFTHRAPSGISARRATYETDKDIEMAIVLEKDEAHSDQMDFLINDAYGAGFDYNADFTKMMNNTQLNLYGVLMEDNLSFVALDHFTARGSIAIGYQVPSAGEYTLRISDKPYVMLDRIEALYVTDHEMNPAVTTNLMEEDYVFQVGKAEINDTRFTISFGAETNNGNGGDITTDMSEIDIHSQQPQKFLYDGRLYILRDGKVYSATGHEIKTINQ